MKVTSILRYTIRVGVAFVFSICCNAEMLVMDGMQTFRVGDELIHNGANMKIQAFSFSGSPEQVLAFYESHWQQPAGSGQPGFIRNEIGEWQIISRLENGENQLVQVKSGDTGLAEGYLSTHTLGELTGIDKELAALPIKNGSDVVSVTRSSDPGREATTWMVTNRQSVDANTQYYSDRATILGWQQMSQRRFGDVSVLLFDAPQAQIEIVIHRNSRGVTVILANLVKLMN